MTASTFTGEPMVVRIKGVKPIRAKGRLYYYHRKTMTRLPGHPGSAEFMAALTALNTKRERAAALPGTLGSLIAAYRASPEFAALAPATKQQYQKVLDGLAPNAGKALVTITRESLYELRDLLMASRKRAFTNLTLAVLQRMFNWGMRRGLAPANPVVDVEKIRRPRSSPVVNRPWTPAELGAVLKEAPAWLRVPVALAAYTGLRESDVLRITWAAYDGAAIETRSQKIGVETWVPAHPRLREILDAAPRLDDRIVLGARGKPIGRSTLTTAFFDLLRRLRDERTVGDGLSFHGLRHTLGTALAEAGCDPGTIAAILGHETMAMAAHYSRHANRRHLATEAMRKLEERP